MQEFIYAAVVLNKRHPIQANMNRLKVSTHKNRAVVDITKQVQAELHRDHARQNGVCHLLVLHTTAALTTADLDPGTDLILNAHIMTMGMPMQAKPSIGLYFTDKPPSKFPLLIELERDSKLDIPAGARDFAVADDLHIMPQRAALRMQ